MFRSQAGWRAAPANVAATSHEFSPSEKPPIGVVRAWPVLASKKYRDMKTNPRVAIVIDDLASVDPWTSRGLEVRGTAELQDSGGGERFPRGFDEAWVRIVPERVVSWGIQASPFTGPVPEPGEMT